MTTDGGSPDVDTQGVDTQPGVKPTEQSAESESADAKPLVSPTPTIEDGDGPKPPGDNGNENPAPLVGDESKPIGENPEPAPNPVSTPDVASTTPDQAALSPDPDASIPTPDQAAPSSMSSPDVSVPRPEKIDRESTVQDQVAEKYADLDKSRVPTEDINSENTPPTPSPEPTSSQDTGGIEAGVQPTAPVNEATTSSVAKVHDEKPGWGDKIKGLLGRGAKTEATPNPIPSASTPTSDSKPQG